MAQLGEHPALLKKEPPIQTGNPGRYQPRKQLEEQRMNTLDKLRARYAFGVFVPIVYVDIKAEIRRLA